MTVEAHSQRPAPDDGASTRPAVLRLDDPSAETVELVGAKAASLARSSRAGLPVLPGFVLTTAFDASSLDADEGAPGGGVAAREAWRALSDDGRTPLVVRSSATKEDTETSSMAGVFVSKVDVRDWDAFVAATREVLASRDAAADVDGVEMAVLVQPLLVPTWGGVLFSVDPVTERRDRMTVSAVPGGPDRLVSGEVDGWSATLTRKGRIVSCDEGDHPHEAGLRELAALAVRLERHTGQPQDIEWAIESGGALRLLQSRPITTLHGPVAGPIYGPGPLAETFPVALAPLEEDLWLEPMREGLRSALRLLGASSRTAVDKAPLVISVGGRPAVDLVLVGADPRKRSRWRALDPRPGVRRLQAAWRVGRLTSALPELAEDLIAEIDDDLLEVPPLDELDEADLLQVLHSTPAALQALHGYEALAGALLEADPSAGAAGLALDALRAASAGAQDGDANAVLEAAPIVLALVPPRIPPTREVPRLDVAPPDVDDAASDGPTLAGVAREALRMRVRWVHELSALAATELARRLVADDVLDETESIRYMRVAELRATVRSRRPFSPGDRPDALRRTELPSMFRLAADGTPVAAGNGGGDGTGTPVGGGRGRGVVRHELEHVEDGTVLVVGSLDPRLATVIPQLAGLVAETGSPLSHLAILAREHGVPTVVARAGATAELHDGDLVEVDGTTGSVEVVKASAEASDPERSPS
jgi:rifampicin phosphotransferase